MSMAGTRRVAAFFLLLALASPTALAARDVATQLIKTASPAGKKPKPYVPPATKPGSGSGGGVGIPTIPGFGSIPGMGRDGFNVPGMGGGWGGGYGGPAGGYSRGGVANPTVVCSEKGPCYKKKVTCPKKCFASYSGSGKGYGGGGGGGGCAVDCKTKCIAYC